MMFNKASLNTLYQYCISLCKNHDDAYDLVQDSVEKYLKHSGKRIENGPAFIRRIARNRFFDLHRRKQTVNFEPFDVLAEPDNDESQLEAMMVTELTLKKIWQSLTSDEREVMFLWAVEGMSASEIALQLEIARSTVLSRMRRLRLRLQDHDAHPYKDEKRGRDES